jgi:hypothetical protein
MDFPRGNRLNKGLPEQAESSAKVLEEHLKKINYKIFIKAYLIVAGLIAVTIFSFIAMARLAIFLIP